MLVLRLLMSRAGRAPGTVTSPTMRPRCAAPPGLYRTSAARSAIHARAVRSPWARLAGIREDLGWAADTLAAAGRPVTGPAVQRKTWNLAALFQLPTVKARSGSRPHPPSPPTRPASSLPWRRSTRPWFRRSSAPAPADPARGHPRAGLLGRLTSDHRQRHPSPGRRSGRAGRPPAASPPACPTGAGRPRRADPQPARRPAGRELSAGERLPRTGC